MVETSYLLSGVKISSLTIWNNEAIYHGGKIE